MRWLSDSVSIFFWFCAGADIGSLKDERGSTERGRYVSIGAAVALTAVLAFVSGSYALYIIFQDQHLSMAFGLLYALIIFNFDRLIVSSIRHNRGFFNALLSALPRLLVAVVIGVIVSKPLELRLFEGEINAHLSQQERLASIQDRAESTKGYPEIARLQAENATAQERMRQAELREEEANKDFLGEIDGSRGSGIKGYKGLAKAKQLERDRRAIDLEAVRTQVADQTRRNDQQITTLQGELESKLTSASMARHKADGFLGRYSALEQMKREDRMINQIDLAIMALFIFIEIGPVLCKLFTRSGPYEALLSTHENVSILESEYYLKRTKADLAVEESLHIQNAEQRSTLMKEQTIAAIAALRQSPLLSEAHQRVVEQMVTHIEEQLKQQSRKLMTESSPAVVVMKQVRQMHDEAVKHAQRRLRIQNALVEFSEKLKATYTMFSEQVRRSGDRGNNASNNKENTTSESFSIKEDVNVL